MMDLTDSTRSSCHEYRGPYSTARTVAGSRVFELDAHVERLASTAQLMWPDQGLPAAMTDPAKLRPLLLDTLRTAILHYRCVRLARRRMNRLVDRVIDGSMLIM